MTQNHQLLIGWDSLFDFLGILPQKQKAMRNAIYRWMDRGDFPKIINRSKHRNTHPIWLQRDIEAWVKSE